MRRAALPLAVTTMAAQGEDGVSDGLVADRAAQASAGSRLRHAQFLGPGLLSVLDNMAYWKLIGSRRRVRALMVDGLDRE
jgi:hypothetical protein